GRPRRAGDVAQPRGGEVERRLTVRKGGILREIRRRTRVVGAQYLQPRALDQGAGDRGHAQGDPRRRGHRRAKDSGTYLTRSSSIVMTLFSGLGVSSDMAAPSCWSGCV